MSKMMGKMTGKMMPRVEVSICMATHIVAHNIVDALVPVPDDGRGQEGGVGPPRISEGCAGSWSSAHHVHGIPASK
jgi:hypothetical protein